MIQSEADFLIATSDRDGSNTLSKEEVLKGKINPFGKNDQLVARFNFSKNG